MRRCLLALVALLAVGCSGAAAPDETQAAAPATPEPAPATAEPAPAPEPAPEQPAPAGPEAGLLAFTAPAVGGGQIAGADYAGRDLALWFWAPW